MDMDRSQADTTSITSIIVLPNIAIMTIFENLPSEKDLNHCAMVCKAWKDLAYSKVLWKNKNIRMNALSRVHSCIPSIKERGVKKITAIIPDGKLERSHMDDMVIDRTAWHIFSITHRLDTLQEISMDNLLLYDRHLCAAFNRPMVNIKIVALSRYGSYTEASILSVLKNCPNIQQLTHYVKQSSAIIQTYRQFNPHKIIGRLTDSLTENISANLPYIVHLDLSYSSISNKGIRNIAQLRKLKCLILVNCYHVREKCIDILSEANSPVKELDLRWCIHIRIGPLLTKIGGEPPQAEKPHRWRTPTSGEAPRVENPQYRRKVYDSELTPHITHYSTVTDHTRMTYKYRPTSSPNPASPPSPAAAAVIAAGAVSPTIFP